MIGKLIRTIIFLTIILAVLAVAAVFLAPMFIPQDWLKEKVASTVKEKTGKDLTIEGDVGLSIFPDLTINLEKAELVDPTTKAVQKLSNFKFKSDVLSMLLSKDLKATAEGNYNDLPISLVVKLDDVNQFNSGGQSDLELEVSQPLSLEFASKLSVTETEISLQDISLAMDQTKAKGNVKVMKSNEKPSIKGELEFGILDVDEILKTLAPLSKLSGAKEKPVPEEQPEKKPETPVKAEDLWSTQPIDLSALNTFNADFKASAESINAGNLSLGKTSLAAQVDSGIATITILESSLYGGKGVGVIKVFATGETPSISQKFRLAGVEVGKIAEDFAKFDRLEGKGSIEIFTSAKGRSLYEMVNALQGEGTIKLVEGAIKRFDLMQITSVSDTIFKNLTENIKTDQLGAVTNAATMVKDAVTKAINSENNTEILGLISTFQINDGTIYNDDFQAQTPFAEVSGKGAVNIPKLLMNYRTETKIGAKGTRPILPIIFKGDVRKPDYELDKEAITKQVFDLLAKQAEKVLEKKATEQIDKFIQKNEGAKKVEEMLEQNLGKDLKGTLKDLLSK